MCSKPNHTPTITGEGVCRTTQSGVASALQYTLPVYRENKGCSYIEFYAYDPVLGGMRRKRIKTNRIKGVRQYVNDVIKRITDQLIHGWNPWIAKDDGNLDKMEDAINRYEAHIEKMLESGYFFRKETYTRLFSIKPCSPQFFLVILHCISTPMTNYFVGWVGLRHISKAFTALDSWLLRTSQPLKK